MLKSIYVIIVPSFDKICKLLNEKNFLPCPIFPFFGVA